MNIQLQNTDSSFRGPLAPSRADVQAELAAELALVEEAKAGNSEAFAKLVRNYDRNVYQLAIKITRNHEDAEEVLQEALFKAYANLDRFQGRSRFSTWLVRIAINEALMKLRKRSSEKQVSLDEVIETDEQNLLAREIEDPGEHPEELYARREVQEMLAAAIKDLQPRCRAVFVLRELAQLSTAEAAETLQLSVTAVKTRLRRARLQLRERLTDCLEALPC